MTLPLLLLGLGLALILAEVFIPSMGILSVLSAAAIVGSVITAFQISTPVGINFLLAVALLLPAVIFAAVKLLPLSPLGKRMLVGGSSFGHSDAADARDLDLIGQEGEVLTRLRPAGHALLADRRVDVVSRGESIDAGTRVRVLEVSGNRVVVAAFGDADDDNDVGGHPATLD